MDVFAVILAAGKGIRMNSDLPKVYHSICGKPMIVRVVEAVRKAGYNDIYVVVGYQGELIKKACEKYGVRFVEQKERLGTGHAVMQASQELGGRIGTTIVLNGDVPLIRAATIRKLVEDHRKSGAAATVLSANMDDPGSYGRIVRDDEGDVLRIVEQKDADPQQLLIKEVNTGTYCFNNRELFAVLPGLKDSNAQKEYYLTDAIAMLRARGDKVRACITDNNNEVLGVNTKDDLAKLESLCKNEL